MPNRLDETRYPNLASIETKKFRLGLNGYNISEVGQFLSTLVSEVGALQSALETAESEVARLKEQIDAQEDS
jgi:cell division septum initiation protein DivIVA